MAIQQTNQQIPLTPAMRQLIDELKRLMANPVVEAAFNEAVAHVKPFVEDGSKNPWVGATAEYFVRYFEQWFTFLPEPTGGLGKIVPFTYFYLDNKSAFAFLNTFKSRTTSDEYTTEIFNWTVKFIKERGRFMDSPESLKFIEAWLKDPGTHIEDFIVPEGGFKSFNEFFTRRLNPARNPRPIAAPDDGSVLVASADSEINFILSDLTLTKKLDVKSRQLNITQLLNGSKYAAKFEGGTAVSCVLMPPNYHRYHAPASGRIVEGVEVPGIYNGIMDGDHWFNTIFNVGESTTDFSIFEDFHRSYFVIKTEKHGYIAVIPVGLNTISAMYPSLVNNRSTLVPVGGEPVPVKKGDELGHFAYGGSLNILLFQKGVFNAVSVLMGSRLGALGTPSIPEAFPRT
ncbi:phosphatidylserine decarboxylase [Sorangium atrum]|uniref:Phosphatidylserine decarboxylase n=1 Tax=Sorangium atrum TaxID=2995308 RepID=A0ABT5CF41_9BACT|nr:phosphatidylserine decarboxylase [Sorangium aterium]MDC0685025.1 phosphatidylserine decarboxylase [Sorangium aterium]